MDHPRGAAAQGVEAEGSGVGEKVEDRPASGQPFHPAAVLPLIAVEAGLLAAGELRSELKSRLQERCLGRGLAGDGLIPAGRQALGAPRRQVVVLEDGKPGERFPEGGVGFVAQGFETGDRDLAHQDVSEAVHGPAGQAIAFRVEDPVAGRLRREHGIPQGDGFGDALAEEGTVRGFRPAPSMRTRICEAGL